MPPKTKAKSQPKRQAGGSPANSSGGDGLSSTPVDGEPMPNSTYTTSIVAAVNAIKEALPETVSTCALPLHDSEAATEGPLQGLTGFNAPWTQKVFDEKYPKFTKADGMDCAITMHALDVLGSITPWIPYDEHRVRKLIPILFNEPKQFPYKILIPVDFGPGKGLQSSPMAHCMPSELLHAFVLSIADKIGKSTWEAEKKEWIRVLLSMPCTMVRIDKQDDRYAKA